MTELVVNFHGVGSPRRQLEDGEAAYWIATDAYLRVLDMAASGAYGPPDCFAFTFDDGNLSDFDIGAPALEARGLTATFFPLAGRLDMPGSLSAANLKNLVAAGHRIGSHGHRHVDWRRLGEAGAERELVAARRSLEDAAGSPIDAAAIPFGSYDRAVLRRLADAGYRAVYTSDGGFARRGAWLRPRTSVRADMGEADFHAMLSGALSPARRMRRFAAMAKKRAF